jgi:hypothetical protein
MGGSRFTVHGSWFKAESSKRKKGSRVPGFQGSSDMINDNFILSWDVGID